jgi:hypothetical protein
VASPTLAKAQAQEFASAFREDSALLVFTSGEAVAFPPGRLLFSPDVPILPATLLPVFAVADTLEIQKYDYAAVVAGLLVLERQPDPAIRAEGQACLARCLAKSGEDSEALMVYNDLLESGTARIMGLPAELIALEGGLLIREREQSREVQHEALALMPGSAAADGKSAARNSSFGSRCCVFKRCRPTNWTSSNGFAPRLWMKCSDADPAILATSPTVQATVPSSSLKITG